ncbi:hypothetical protein, partial [Salmonella enterica]|uniref:hypothetical protein n=2 Tax=Enterobacterales TaxID=91347 RepID=UPI001CB7A326
IPVCRSADTSARAIFGHNKTWREIYSGRGVTEQQLGHCHPLANLTPLIAKLGFCPDAGLPFWAGLLSLAPIMRKVPADTD